MTQASDFSWFLESNQILCQIFFASRIIGASKFYVHIFVDDNLVDDIEKKEDTIWEDQKNT